MSWLNTQVLWYVNLDVGNEWVLDGSALNELDTGGVLDGDAAVDLSEFLHSSGVSIRRGRTDQFSDFTVGTATITLEDHDRRFDSTHTTGPYYGLLVAGKQVDVVTDGVTLFSGRVRSWRSVYRQNGPAIVTLIVEDALARLGRRKFDAWTTTAGQTPSERIMSVLQRPEVNYTNPFTEPVDLDQGVFTLTGDSVSHDSNPLNYLQLVAKSDLGRLFASRTNTLTFRDRLSATGGVPEIVLDDNGGGIEPETIERSDDAKALATRVSIDRVGGTAQTSVNEQAEVDFDGIRAFSLSGLLLQTDVMSKEMADYLVNTLSVPEPRIESATVKVQHVPALYVAALLELDLASTIGVLWRPLNVGADVDTTAIVEGLEHRITAFDHTVSLRLSTVENRSPWTLEDDILGALDTGGVLSF